MRLTLEQTIREIDKVYEFYRTSSIPEARKCYDDYIKAIIKNYIPKDSREFHLNYWERLIENEK